MYFPEDFDPMFFLSALRHKSRLFTEALIQRTPASLSSASCHYEDSVGDVCRDDAASFHLKMLSIVAILVAGVSGVAIPLVGRKRRFLRTDGRFFVLAKAFSAGVILATGFVHMLHDAQTALTDSCLPEFPWRKFPFPGFVAMLAALGTLVVDFVGTQIYERKHRDEQIGLKAAAAVVASSDLIVPVASEIDEEAVACGKDPMHIVGIRAHATPHQHVHTHEGEHGLANANDDGKVSSHVRHVVVSQAHFRNGVAALMACFFAITTPAGVGAGTVLARKYDSSSQRALVVEGVLDSVSAGILIYMALVDLIAADFLSHRMSCDSRMQAASYFALFLGAVSMSSLAIWA